VNDEADKPLAGRVALVAGATRGASRRIAVELAHAGAHVYATGRSSEKAGPSEYRRPETIEAVGRELAAVGTGTALRVDHLEPDQVARLARRIDDEHGRLDILVIGLFGADHYMQFDTPFADHDLHGGLRMLRVGVDAHVITCHALVRLLQRTPDALFVELTDGTREYNRDYRHQAGLFYDLAKAAADRVVLAMSHELAGSGGTAVGVTPGWMRSEAMLDAFGVTEENWRDALAQEPYFAISETPTFVARGVAALAADPGRARHTGEVLTAHQLAVDYDVRDLDGSRPDAWRYIPEVQAAGGPPDASGYR
jgi:NAD(P)-dependent dehydrogenase (short-subunit alcohol dehydrogenase family)